MPRKPRRKGERGGSPQLLRLWSDYLANPAAFARPSPPPAEPLPLKFTCKSCGYALVDPNASRCPECRAKFYNDH